MNTIAKKTIHTINKKNQYSARALIFFSSLMYSFSLNLNFLKKLFPKKINLPEDEYRVTL